MTIALHNAPTGWTLPGVITEGLDDQNHVDLLIAFFERAEDLPERMPLYAVRIFPDGALWAAWPRRAAGHHSDIRDSTVREFALPLGIVDNKVAAIDDDWSGLRFVWRRELRGRPRQA